jgi:GNAT superfamily N-acetyltransferase
VQRWRRPEPAPRQDVDAQLRAAAAEDVDFLTEMLVEACNWTGTRRIGQAQVTADPELARYVIGWPRAHDFGVVAIGDGSAPIGAAWARVFDADDPGYGFVAPDVPEISMAVVRSRRDQGIGRRLLANLCEQARVRGWRRLSLSVEHGNPAGELYRDAGFIISARHRGSDTMLLDLTTT